jgi:hypothetical protein
MRWFRWRKNMTITNKDVIRWSSFQVDPEARNSAPDVKRFGFMSQVSPDGRYVVTSIGPPTTGTTPLKTRIPASRRDSRIASTAPTTRSFAFNQVFYPTRGILAWYDKQQKKMRPLPGADDPAFVQTSAFWSPDGKYLIFSRAVRAIRYPPELPPPTRQRPE